MVKHRYENESERESLLAQGYTKCPSCSNLVKPGKLRCDGCGRLMSKGRRIVAFLAAIIVLSSSIIVYLNLNVEGPVILGELPKIDFVSPEGTSVALNSEIIIWFNVEMDRDTVESAFSISPNIKGLFSWTGKVLHFPPSSSLSTGTNYVVTIGPLAADKQGQCLDNNAYCWSFKTTGESSPPPPTPTRRTVGFGSENFWVAYPTSHPLSGGSVNHPSWVETALDSKIVLILDHSVGCAPCVQMTAICEAVAPGYSSKMAYFDLTSGTNEPQASDVFAAYDPTGGVNYVPLTVIVTMVKDLSGNVAIGWHSWEGVVDQATLESWISNALFYFEENK